MALEAKGRLGGTHFARRIRLMLLLEARVDLFLPIASVTIQQVGPPHLPRNELISLRVIQIFLQQFHVAFGALLLLLKKSFPIVLVPNVIRRVVRHVSYLRSAEAENA